MATTIKLKSGSGAPLAGDLVAAEPAFDLTNKRLYTENASGTVIEVGTNPTSLTTGTFTSTGIDDNATSTAITIDSSQNVGIGASSPGAPLQVGGASAGDAALWFNTSGTSYAEIEAVTFGFNFNMPLVLQRQGGNVGIGTTSPNGKLDITGSGNTDIYLNTGNNSGDNNRLFFGDTADIDVGYLSYDHGTNTMSFGVNAAEHMRINSSGQVGIGTTTIPVWNGNAGRKFAVTGPSSNTNAIISLQSGATATDNGAIYEAYSTNTTSGSVALGSIAFLRANTSTTALSSYTAFYTNNSGTVAERMRIDSSGNLLVGATSVSAAVSGVNVYGATATHGIEISNTAAVANGVQAAMFLAYGGSTANLGCYKHSGVTNPAGYLFLSDSSASNYFLYHNGGTWRTSSNSNEIGTTSGTVIGTQTSDERLKNIEPTFEYGIDHVMRLNPIVYTRNDEEAPVRRLGFGAQSTQTVVPEAVYDTGECLDGYDQDPDDVMVQTARSSETKLAMEYVQLIPVLTKAIQELSAQVTELKAEVAALKGA